jgi:hypothetical protein
MASGNTIFKSQNELVPGAFSRFLADVLITISIVRTNNQTPVLMVEPYFNTVTRTHSTPAIATSSAGVA